MDVILTREVPKLGRAGEVKTVSNGYAQNFLFPQGLAEMATPEKVKSLQTQQAEQVAQTKEELDTLQTVLEKLSADPVVVKVKANEKGGLYEQIGTEQVAVILSERGKAPISTAHIDLAAPIKEVGKAKFAVNHPNKKIELTLDVQPE